jgi:hypothetical protein
VDLLASGRCASWSRVSGGGKPFIPSGRSEDTLIDRGKGFEFPADWANKGVPAAEILASLQPLLELPVLHVLPTHGPPTDRTALERVLA